MKRNIKVKGGEENMVMIRKRTCLKCGHSWYPRSEEYPRSCPKCHSVRWDCPNNPIPIENDKKQ